MIYLDLIKATRNAYNPAPFVEVLTVMFDIRTRKAPARIDIHNISNPHSFVLEENSKGDVVLRYKIGRGTRSGNQAGILMTASQFCRWDCVKN